MIFDYDTIHADYAESFQHYTHIFNSKFKEDSVISFDKNPEFRKAHTPAWDDFKKAIDIDFKNNHQTSQDS